MTRKIPRTLHIQRYSPPPCINPSSHNLPKPARANPIALPNPRPSGMYASLRTHARTPAAPPSALHTGTTRTQRPQAKDARTSHGRTAYRAVPRAVEGDRVGCARLVSHPVVSVESVRSVHCSAVRCGAVQCGADGVSGAA